MTTERETSNGCQAWYLDRRNFLKTGAFLGGSALLAGQLQSAMDLMGRAEAQTLAGGGAYPLAKPENILYSVCLQCNTGCGIKAKVVNGVVVKIDGNPLDPMNLTPHLPYKSSPFDIATYDAILCPKGQAGLQSAYDPYRIVKVLKRAGKRGSNEWVTIPFDQAVKEIVEGGELFKNVPGEENRKVAGLKEIWALRDPKLAKALAEDAKAVQAKKMTAAEFKAKNAEHLGLLIDPEHPDLGPRNNQFVFAWGRLKAGRGDFINRFTKDAFGSVNAHGHTTVCQGSLYFSGKAMSEQYKEGKWTGGAKFYWQADTGNSEFIIFVGASPLEGNYGPPLRIPKITEGLTSGRLRIAVVDPRFSKTAAKAWRWLPNKPGTEGALALALIRWVIDNQRFDARFLANANKAAAKADGEPTWTNAAWLVKLEKDGAPGAFLRAKEIGLSEKDLFVVLKDGKPVAVDPYDEANAVEGDLFVTAEVSGIKVKSGLQLLKESASARTIEEWADIAGVNARDIVDLATEFTSHGKKAAADIHRGVSQHTNGFYNVVAWYALNLLIGNYDWKGGMIKATAYNAAGGREGQPFPIGKLMPGKAAPFGISSIRHDVKYEDTTLFSGYPAKRPWFPLSSDLYQEIVPSAGDAYPYPIKALFLYMGSPVYSLPAGHTNIPILADVEKVPLFVTSDIVIGETSMYADYIFPDLSYLERWEFHGSHPSVAPKIQPVRQPVIAPIPEAAKVFGEEMPISLEALLLAIAERLGLPGFGKDGFGPGQPFTRPEDFYLRMVANVAAGDRAGDEVPDASDEEVKLFLASRRHLPKTVFDAARWEQIVGTGLWRKVIYVLNRGGRFQDADKAYDGEKAANKYGTLINLYQEKTAKTKNAMTGKPFPGLATYIPAPQDSLGRPIEDRGYDLRLITFREISHTKSRTAADYWLLHLLPENSVIMNEVDAKRLGFKDGQTVKLTSASNPEGVWDLKNGQKRPIAGKLRVIQGIRPGVVAFSLGHGHWAYGSADVRVDGKVVKGDPRRGKGLHANAALRVDPVLGNTCLSDLTGGSAVFYDTQVKVVKV
ncbi:MAG: putative molybdopterin oxidoreductase molybdopterin binding subunit [Candidatus Rokubacteria bacterium CSP1-6]|nr:MAG: putative molybdopterin oxidoreductase molybdopterin binding subunit [Candidatus Rokubacteria bacterium CSP1-6]